MLVAAPAAAWWARAPLIVHGLVEAVQSWRDALFPYATPAPLTRAPRAAAADPLGERIASEGWNFTRLAIGETISFALSASATVILLYFLLASERWLVPRTVAACAAAARALVLAGVRQAQRDIGLFISTMGLVNIALGVATGLALGRSACRIRSCGGRRRRCWPSCPTSGRCSSRCCWLSPAA